jgi:hypothetical protein
MVEPEIGDEGTPFQSLTLTLALALTTSSWQTRVPQAEVAKLADAPDLGSGLARGMGSSPFLGK